MINVTQAYSTLVILIVSNPLQFILVCWRRGAHLNSRVSWCTVKVNFIARSMSIKSILIRKPIQFWLDEQGPIYGGRWTRQCHYSGWMSTAKYCHILLEHRVPLQCSYLDIDILIIHQSQCFSLIRLIPELLLWK